MMKKLPIIIFSVFLLLIVILFNLDTTRRIYIYFFKKSVLIKHYNSKGQYDGELIEYLNGRHYFSANFRNGLKEGWVKRYFKNGQLKNEQYYKQDKPNGLENEFYDNGILNYTAHWKNGIRTKSEYHYLPNSKLLNYDSFDINSNNDINKSNIICYAEYNSSGKLIKLIGNVFGDNIYSKVNKDNSNIILDDNKEYSYINDLYVTVATPPSLISQVEININNKKYYDLRVKENTVIIPHAFPNIGKFMIVVVGKFINSDKIIVKSDTLRTFINVVR